MSKGVEIRSQIDTETVRALLLINGGGAVALLSLLPSILGKDGYDELAQAILVGLLLFMVGLTLAAIHNQLRRMCSLHYEQHAMRPPAGRLLGLSLRRPTVCFLSLAFMWLSISAFFFAGAYVAAVGMVTVQHQVLARGKLESVKKRELESPSAAKTPGATK